MGKGKKTAKGDSDSEMKMVYTHGKKRNAIANAVIQEGNGSITINRIPIQNIEPKTLRIKIFEPILILGVDKFKNLRIKVRVSGGGSVAQLYAARTAIAKGIVAWNQKYLIKNIQVKLVLILLFWDYNILSDIILEFLLLTLIYLKNMILFQECLFFYELIFVQF